MKYQSMANVVQPTQKMPLVVMNDVRFSKMMIDKVQIRGGQHAHIFFVATGKYHMYDHYRVIIYTSNVISGYDQKNCTIHVYEINIYHYPSDHGTVLKMYQPRGKTGLCTIEEIKISSVSGNRLYFNPFNR